MQKKTVRDESSFFCDIVYERRKIQKIYAQAIHFGTDSFSLRVPFFFSRGYGDGSEECGIQ